MPDSGAVDAAIVARLAGDTALMALMKDGVYFDVAASGKTKFVIVSLATSVDDHEFCGTAFEESTYLVKAVTLGTSGTEVRTAAARIHVLLQNAPLTVSGYANVLLRRSEYVRYTEVDDVDNDIRWQHRGGRYDVWVSPSA